MRLRHVECLIALAESGSIRAAAERLGKSQSALTKQLRQMEEEAGLSLFHRTSRGITPTSQALSLMTRARSIESELQRLDQEIAELRGLQAGGLRISAAPLAAAEVLPVAIARFRRTHPNIDINISSDLFDDALVALREGQHDILIGPYNHAQEPGDITSEALFTTEIAVITSQEAAHANARSLQELVDCCWAMMGNTTGAPRRRFQQQFTRHGLKPPRISLGSESRLGLIALIEEMHAVCTFPVPLLETLQDHCNITRIPVKESLQPLTISMVTRAGQSLTPAGEKLADCIRHSAMLMVQRWAESDDLKT